MKYQFSDVEFNQQTIAGFANDRPFIADAFETQAYTDRLLDVYEEDVCNDRFREQHVVEEITDVDFWESLLKYLYKTLGDEYGKVIRYLESGE